MPEPADGFDGVSPALAKQWQDAYIDRPEGEGWLTTNQLMLIWGCLRDEARHRAESLLKTGRVEKWKAPGGRTTTSYYRLLED